MYTTSFLDRLQHLRELNRAFLSLLQTRAGAQRDCLGLAAALRPLLRSAPAELLDAVADLPRALFRLQLEPRPRQPVAGAQDWAFDPLEHDVGLLILEAARHASRQSPYHARLLFGLEPLDVQGLVALTLSDAQRLARTPGLVRCAFGDRPWFWRDLLTATNPESRRHLTLVALQPALLVDWPLRRPPQPAT